VLSILTYKKHKMLNGTYYLNNSGSRWVVFENGKKPKHKFETKSGKIVERTAIFYEAFGNFGSVCISYKGKKRNVLADTILED
jgi:hypothetical protein